MSNDCLPLTDVLKAEYRSIHNFYPEGVLDWKFKREHIIDPSKMVLRLQKVETTKEPLTRRIREKLPLEAREQLKQCKPVGSPPESLQNYIVEALNSLLRDPDLCNMDGLSRDSKVEAATRAQMDMSALQDFRRRAILPVSETMSFNRRLLEIVFSNEIKPIQNTLSAVYDHIHSQEHAALCLSGGGVRSATFGLGVIQALAEKSLLNKFDYLSTVSGGGYIGGWLSAWSHRHPKGLDGVMNELRNGLNRASVSSKDPEPKPVRQLRTFSNYLTPKLGLLSADSWALIGIYLRNLLLNWLVLIPFLAAAVIIPKLYVGIVDALHVDATAAGTTITVVTYVVLAVGLLLFLISAIYTGFNRPSTGYRTRGLKSFLLGGLMPLVLGAACLAVAFGGFTRIDHWHFALAFALAGAGFQGLGWLLQFPARDYRPDQIVEFPAPSLWEFVAAVATGAFGGLLIWWVFFTPHGSGILAQSGLPEPEIYACLAVPLLLLLILVAETIFIGLVSKSSTDEDREWWARAGGLVLLAAVAWAVLNTTILFGPRVLPEWSKLFDDWRGNWFQALFASFATLSGVLTILIGKSAKTPAKTESKSGSNGKDEGRNAEALQQLLAKRSLPLLSTISVFFLITLISSGVNELAKWANELWLAKKLATFAPWTGHLTVSQTIYAWPALWILLSGLVLMSLLMALFVDVNKFSLNAGYKNRIIRAYLGASRNYRHPNRFTGFDPEDNPPIFELEEPNRFGFLKKKLFPVLNLTLNLASGKNLAWQERKAESFTVTPLHCGNRDIGYRSSREYCRTSPPQDSNNTLPLSDGQGEEPKESSLPISLGFAMSLSGAAASPNMGYISSMPVAFLMTLFNVRLGAWLSNPGKCGDKSQGRPYPRSSYSALLHELLGLTDDASPYVYLSDGGHFENLGLYEMVLRRCRHIVVIDAGHDPGCAFGDLGKAIRKIRTDLGVRIEFKEVNIYPRDDKLKHDKRTYCAIGTIGYSKVDGEGTDGRLLYIKPAFYEEGDLPRDVYEYAKRCSEFPHDSTADQWFSESQFESYRALGYHISKKISDKCADNVSLKQFFDYVQRDLSGEQSDTAGQVEVLAAIFATGNASSERTTEIQ